MSVIYWCTHYGGFIVSKKIKDWCIESDPLNFKPEHFEELDKSEGYKKYVKRQNDICESNKRMLKPLMDALKKREDGD